MSPDAVVDWLLIGFIAVNMVFLVIALIAAFVTIWRL